MDISQCDSSVTGTCMEGRQLDLARISAKAFPRWAGFKGWTGLVSTDAEEGAWVRAGMWLREAGH